MDLSAPLMGTKNIVKQEFWVPWSFLRESFLNPIIFLNVKLWVFYCLPNLRLKASKHSFKMAAQSASEVASTKTYLCSAISSSTDTITHKMITEPNLWFSNYFR